MVETKRHGLTRKQKAFVDEYLATDESAYKIYQSVYGCKESTASVNSSKLLDQAKVQAYITHSDRKKITRGSNAGIDKLIELIDSDDPNVAFKAAKELAHMAGHKPTERVQHSGQMEHEVAFYFGSELTEDDI